MKKIIALFLVVVMVCSLSACKKDKPVETDPPATEAPVVETLPPETEPPVIETEPPVEEDWSVKYDDFIENYDFSQHSGAKVSKAGMSVTTTSDGKTEYVNIVMSSLAKMANLSIYTTDKDVTTILSDDSGVYFNQSPVGEVKDGEEISSSYTAYQRFIKNHSVVEYNHETSINGMKYDVLNLTTLFDPIYIPQILKYHILFTYDGAIVEFDYYIYEDGSEYFDVGCPWQLNRVSNPDATWHFDLENETVSTGTDTFMVNVQDCNDGVETLINVEPTVAQIYINRETQLIEIINIMEADKLESPLRIDMITGDVPDIQMPANIVEISEEEMSVKVDEYSKIAHDLLNYA